jgi:DNA-binding CsgD family transcriptional regulator
MEAELGRAYANLISASGEARLYRLSAAAHREALSYFVARDLDGHAGYARAWHARCLFEQGDWVAATVELDGARAAAVTATANTRLIAHYVQARLNARRGAPDVSEELDDAQRIADATGSLQRLAPVAAARAEAQWLAGEPPDIEGLTEVYTLAVQRANGWAIGELGFWLFRFGQLTHLPANAGAPFQLHVAGELGDAAAEWLALGCRYEAAEAWCDSTQEDDVRRALDIYTELDAKPARQRAARRLRELGVRSIPRGPRAATARHPDGLTERENEVLEWLRSGHTDAEIAVRLHLSVRTVGHHVSAVLRKTGVHNRRDLQGR